MLLTQKRCTLILSFLLIFFGSLVLSQSNAEDLNIDRDLALSYWSSRNYFAKGVYYLINQEDLDKAEEQFKKAILSSPIDSFLSVSKDSSDRQIVARSFYFLGKIYYDRANKTGETTQNIGKSKFYLSKANEYGIIYSPVNPPLLDEINRKYPNIPAVTQTFGQSKTKVTIDTQDKTYKLDAVRIDSNLSITRDSFTTNRELKLKDNSRYKIKPNYKSSYKTIYGAIIIFGIAVAFWLARE